jgi:hypothetical protein
MQPVIEYQRPIPQSPEQQRRRADYLWFLLGAALSICAAIGLAVYAVGINTYYIIPNPPPPVRFVSPLIAATLTFAGLGVIAVSQFRLRKSLAFAKGMAIGGALAVILFLGLLRRVLL